MPCMKTYGGGRHITNVDVVDYNKTSRVICLNAARKPFILVKKYLFTNKSLLIKWCTITMSFIIMKEGDFTLKL